MELKIESSGSSSRRRLEKVGWPLKKTWTGFNIEIKIKWMTLSAVFFKQQDSLQNCGGGVNRISSGCICRRWEGRES